MRVDLYFDVINRLDNEHKLKNIDKKIIILLFNYIEKSRFIKTRKQDTLTLIRKFEKFDFFIIFTCNSYWFEFTRDLFFEMFIENRFDFCARVFQLKLKKLFRDFIERHVLEKIKIYIYIIEFQKRDLFYTYILIINYFRDDVKKGNLSYVVQVVIFSRFFLLFRDVVEILKQRLYRLVIKYIIYYNCFEIEKTIYYNKENECSKRFSKSIYLELVINYFSNYSLYSRLSMKNVSTKEKKINNQ